VTDASDITSDGIGEVLLADAEAWINENIAAIMDSDPNYDMYVFSFKYNGTYYIGGFTEDGFDWANQSENNAVSSLKLFFDNNFKVFIWDGSVQIETTPIALNAEYKAGDVVKNDTDHDVYIYNMGTNSVILPAGATVTLTEENFENEYQWGWYLVFTPGLAGTGPSSNVFTTGNTYSTLQPIGYIISGSGTKADPYKFNVVTEQQTKTDISTATVTVDSLTYDGTEQAPTVTVKVGDETISSGYTLSGRTSAKAPGIYTATIVGDETTCTGSKEFTWTIDEADSFTVNVTNGTLENTPDEDGKFASQTLITAIGNTRTGHWEDGAGKILCTEQKYTFYILDFTDIKWVEEAVSQYEDGIANVNISDRAPTADGKTKVTITSTWRLPKGAKIVKAGTYRMYTTGNDTADKNDMLTNGSFNASTLKTINGTFFFNLTMKPTTAAKTLWTMTYVKYQLADGTDIEIMSDVVSSNP
jgi:hypothetical protein